jgi:Cu2+-exporting ATPase/Cu+-exporting ATPase
MEVGLGQSSLPTEMNFFVEGVRCSNCVHKLENLSSEHPELCESRFNKSRSLLTLNSTALVSPESAIQWIEEKGYKAYFVESSKQTEECRQKVQRQWLIRLAVTFFFASNLMMFAIAIYMGATEEWQKLFGWFCGILFLPIACYSAIPFYKSGWQAVKERRFSADLAIVVAFVWGSSLSYFNLFRGSTDFYFDSTASFLFLILLARFLLDRAQNSIESDLNPSLLFKSAPFFEIISDLQPKMVYYHQIKLGDVLIMKPNQTLPVDIELLSDAADIDTSLFSGESHPLSFYKGNRIKAGMVVLSDGVRGIATGAFPESELNQIFEGVIRNRHEKTQAHAKAEIYSQRLLTTVSVLSVLVLIMFGVQAQWTEGFRRALALFTIACPCALALAIPLASVMTLKRAMAQGLFVKSPLFFEKLRDINGVVFDKTGTVTLGNLEFHSWDPPQPDSSLLPILLAMEQASHHPIGQSLTRLLLAQKIAAVSLDSRTESPGVGINATYKGVSYEITRLTEQQPQPAVRALTGFELSSQGKILLRAYFKDQVRAEVPSLIAQLKKRNLEVHLLSGDRPEVVQVIAGEIGLESFQYQAQMSPQGKAQFLEWSKIENNKNYLMVGDGHNDALALSKAAASLAVKGSAETSLRAADAYAQKSDLNIILIAINLSHFYHRLIQQNVGLSLVYNLIAGSMAVSGYVDPLMAAVLMPINSLVVIGATIVAQPRKIKDY